jgi:hypothetical protein
VITNIVEMDGWNIQSRRHCISLNRSLQDARGLRLENGLNSFKTCNRSTPRPSSFVMLMRMMKNEMGYVLKYCYLHIQISLRYTLYPSNGRPTSDVVMLERESWRVNYVMTKIGASYPQFSVFFASEIRKAITHLTSNEIGDSRRMEFTLHFKFNDSININYKMYGKYQINSDF